MNSSVIRNLFFTLCTFFFLHGAAGATGDLVHAVDKGDLAGALKALGFGAKLDATLEGTPLLFVSMLRNDFDMFSLLLENGADPDEEVTCGMTPVLLAIFSNQPVMLSLLLKHQANPNKATSVGVPLLYAAALGYFGMVEVLLRAGVDPQQRGNRGETILHWAAYSNNVAMVKKFIFTYGVTSCGDKDGALPVDITKNSLVKYYLNLGTILDAAQKAGVDLNDAVVRKASASIGKNFYMGSQLSKDAFFEKVCAACAKDKRALKKNRMHGAAFTAYAVLQKSNRPHHCWKGMTPRWRHTPLSA